ncbi:hypothetical protein R6Q57_014809 [Mikania cordata]
MSSKLRKTNRIIILPRRVRDESSSEKDDACPEIPGHGLRFSLDRKHVWEPLQSPPQPHLSEQPPPDPSSPDKAPLDQPPPAQLPPQHPPLEQPLPQQPYNEPQHRVVQQPSSAYADILREHAAQLDRVEDMMRWLVEQQAMATGIPVPVFIRPRHDPDPQDPPDHD